MAHILENLVEQGSTSRGEDPIRLTVPASAPYRGFADVMADGDITEIMVVNNDRRDEWQAGVYRYAAETLTLVRFIDSATRAPLSFGTGLKRVYMAPLAKRGEFLAVGDSFEALPFDRLYLPSGGSLNLPSLPSAGDRVEVEDRDGTWPSDPPTIDGNGKSIEFLGATDTSVQLASGGTFVFDADADLWRVN